MSVTAPEWLERIRALPLTETIKVMNVCGGHERTVTMSGMRTALPEKVKIIPGPGCPVCVCPEEDIYAAIQLALHADVILATYGDMLRAPVNAPKSEPRNLEQARGAGGDVRPVASPLEAPKIAMENPDRQVVFFAPGFETTTAPTAGLLAQGIPDNLSILLSGRLTWPAVALLLDSGTPGFDALVAPGHVSAVAGPEDWAFVVEKHALPAAVAGFTPESLLAAIYSTLRQVIEGRAFLDNCYPEVVKKGGNRRAQALMEETMTVVAAPWRGVGSIPASGYALKEAYAAHDARRLWPDFFTGERRFKGEMPPGCDCAEVVMGRKLPVDCRLYGEPCVPRSPIGPCMVSDEGACRIWWAGGTRKRNG